MSVSSLYMEELEAVREAVRSGESVCTLGQFDETLDLLLCSGYKWRDYRELFTQEDGSPNIYCLDKIANRAISPAQIVRIVQINKASS